MTGDNALRARIAELLVQLSELPIRSPARRRLRDEVVCVCLPLARRTARRFGGRGEEIDDLTQVALVGLVKAVDRFDRRKGEFLNYAVPTMAGEIKRYFRDCGWAMHVQRPLQERHLAVLRAVPELSQEMLGTPSVSDVAEHLGIEVTEAREALSCASAYTTRSLNTIIGDDRDGGELGEMLGEPDQALERVPDLVALRQAVRTLTGRQRELLRLRYLEGLTQAEIGMKVGVSQMHVSRLLGRAVAALREKMLVAG